MSRNKLSPVSFVLGAVALFSVGQALFFGNSGCSSGGVCYRVTDCPIGDRCVSGTCMHRIEVGNNGTGGSAAGGASTATGGTGGAGTMTGALSSSDGGDGGMGGQVSFGEAGMSGAAGMGGV